MPIWSRIANLVKQLIERHGSNVVVPVGCAFNKYYATLTCAGDAKQIMCPPIYEGVQREFEEFWLGLLDELDVAACSIIWGERFEGEDMDPQEEYDYGPFIRRLKMRTVGGCV